MSLKVDTAPTFDIVGSTEPSNSAAVTRRQPADDDIICLRDCPTPDSVFLGMAAAEATRVGLDERALGVRTLLHLPRVATPDGQLTREQITAELRRASRQLDEDVQATANLVPAVEYELRDLHFERISSSQAGAVLQALHYLRSARPGSFNFALLDPARRLPVSLCSVSPLEWRRVGNRIHGQFGVPRARIWDVSRVYSCDGAPFNTISFLLARVRQTLRRGGEQVDLLTTAVDPNLGFTGASYRAANWQQWLTIQPRPYLYHNCQYVSPRQLRQRFGTSNLAVLQETHPDQRFVQSEARLRDSLIFGWRLRGETEIVPQDQQHRLHR